jgi:hypothetical protein
MGKDAVLDPLPSVLIAGPRCSDFNEDGTREEVLSE